MKLRTRLILTTVGVALLLVLPALYAALQLDRLRDIASTVGSTHGAAYLAMGRFQARLAELDRLTRAYVAIPEEENLAALDSAMVAARRHAANLGRAGYEDLALVAVTRLDTISRAVNRIKATLPDTEAATDQLDAVKPLFAQADTVMQALSAEIDTRTAADLRRAERISATAMATTLLALIACFFIAALLGAWGAESLVRPLDRLRRAMAAVTAGEYVVPKALPYEREDEVGDVSRSFRTMTRQLRALDRMKADFMSVATHELKTPINVVSGYAELMQEGIYGEPNPKQQMALTAIQEQARVMAQLVTQLLDISRLEAGGMKMQMDPVNVGDLIERVERTFSVLAHQQGVDLSIEMGDDAPRTIRGDADRLRDQVLGNLLSNALKFTPRGGRVAVRAGGSRDELVVEVADTGEGMAADQLPHVFDKYFQIGEQARSKGAGLGLTIAHEVVVGHGGDITVDSEPGRGTTFRVMLPAAGATSPPASEESGE